MRFTQIRNATAVLVYAGKRLLIDPCFAEREMMPGISVAADPRLRNPTVDLPCQATELLAVDAVLVTHLHFDHFDAEAARLLPKGMPRNYHRYGKKVLSQFMILIWANVRKNLLIKEKLILQDHLPMKF